MDLDQLRRFWGAAGLSEQGDTLYDEDVRALERSRRSECRPPEEALAQLTESNADARDGSQRRRRGLVSLLRARTTETQGLSEGENHGGFQSGAGAHDTAHRSPLILYFHRKGFSGRARGRGHSSLRTRRRRRFCKGGAHGPRPRARAAESLCGGSKDQRSDERCHAPRAAL